MTRSDTGGPVDHNRRGLRPELRPPDHHHAREQRHPDHALRHRPQRQPAGIQGGIDGAPSPNGGIVTDLGPLGFTLHATNDGGFDIAPGPGPQQAFAALTDAVDSLTRLYTINLSTAVTATAYTTGFESATAAVGLIGNGLTEVRSLAIAPRSILVVGAGPGGGPHVRVFDAGTGSLRRPPGSLEKFSFFAYAPAFTGGVRVAAGDVTGDGVADVITGVGPGGGPHVRVFDGVTGAQVGGAIGSFFAFDPGFLGGVYVAAGDINGDGFDDVIVGADAGGGPHVKVFSGRDGSLIASFFADAPTFTGGVRVAAADFNLDGRAEIVTAAGPGGGPHVRIFDNTGAPFPSSSLPNSFYAYAPAFTGGVYVAAGDVNGDQIPDIVTGAGPGGGPHVIAFSGANGSPIASFFAYAPAFVGGVRVATTDSTPFVNGNGRLEILTGAGPGGGPHVRALDATTLLSLEEFFAFQPRVWGRGIRRRPPAVGRGATSSPGGRPFTAAPGSVSRYSTISSVGRTSPRASSMSSRLTSCISSQRSST
jgi:hypothetical protein